MLAVVESRINKGVVHILNFYADNYDKRKNDRSAAKQLTDIVNKYKDRLIQITLIPSQVNNYKETLKKMHELGFQIVFVHTNPNTGNRIRMFLRKPDLPDEFKPQAVSSWEASKETVEGAQTQQIQYHQGACCGYAEVRGFSFDRCVLYSQSYREVEIQKRVKTQLEVQQAFVTIIGEMKLFRADGMAFQMFMPKGFFHAGNYQSDWIDGYLRKAGFSKVYSYLCPTNKTEMQLFISCSNKLLEETWTSLDKEFKLGLGDSVVTEKRKNITTKGPYRDKYGRFASPPRGLSTGDVVAATGVDDYF